MLPSGVDFRDKFHRCGQPPTSIRAPLGGDPGGGAVSTMLRVALLAVLLIYFLPRALQSTPSLLRDARHYVTRSAESVAAILLLPDFAETIGAHRDPGRR
jgi:hypothetical protein